MPTLTVHVRTWRCFMMWKSFDIKCCESTILPTIGLTWPSYKSGDLLLVARSAFHWICFASDTRCPASTSIEFRCPKVNPLPAYYFYAGATTLIQFKAFTSCVKRFNCRRGVHSSLYAELCNSERMENWNWWFAIIIRAKLPIYANSIIVWSLIFYQWLLDFLAM